MYIYIYTHTHTHIHILHKSHNDLGTYVCHLFRFLHLRTANQKVIAAMVLWGGKVWYPWPKPFCCDHRKKKFHLGRRWHRQRLIRWIINCVLCTNVVTLQLLYTSLIQTVTSNCYIVLSDNSPDGHKHVEGKCSWAVPNHEYTVPFKFKTD